MSPPSPPPQSDPSKWVAGKYELIEPAGEGGMASVWRGVTHGAAGFTRPVAIKRILPKLAVDSAFAALFVEEARVVSDLSHPNIVQIHDFDRDADGRHFIVMEWVEGLDLERWVKSFSIAENANTNSNSNSKLNETINVNRNEAAGSGSGVGVGVGVGTGTNPEALPPWPLVAAIGAEVLRALIVAHERVDAAGRPAPVIHRDVNPVNILLSINGVVKLADFGLSRAMDRSSMTAPGIVKGKLGYLSPEILQGAAASVRSDLYSVGITLWEALTGKRLYGGDHPGRVAERVRAGVVPPLREERPDLPLPLVEVVHGALAHKPEERFGSAEEMQRALASILRVHPELTDGRVVGQSVREARSRLKAHS